MQVRAYLLMSAAIFGLVTLGHAGRLFFHWPLHLGGIDIPMWASWFGVLGPGALSAWGFAAARRD